MGDLNAVDLAEEMHVEVLRDSGGMQARHTMIYPRPLPFNFEGFFEGVMIDDHVGLQIVRTGLVDQGGRRELEDFGIRRTRMRGNH